MKTSQLNTASTSNTIVQDIKHNEKGQREAIWYGNGTKTSYEYHEKNYRVLRIYTVNLSTNDMVQDLRYTYDAVGNITTVQDEAQQTVFFNNTMIQPRQEYTYDALYRLVEAKGREKIGIATQGEDRWDDMLWMGEWMPNADPNQLQNYTQTYTYDEAGNMLQLQHQAPNGGYTRDYTIHSTNNQLLSTHIGSDTYSHSYDVLGNMLTMAHLNAMDYNLENSLAHIQRGTDESYYQYRSGQRSRKIVQKQGGITEERIYLGSYEIFRIFAGSSLTLERKTVHVSDDAGRIGMYEYRTQGNDNSPQELMRYIYSNHLQSSMLELDDQGQIISYEEYHPFGTTSYQATNAQINAVAKRYRYSGKERDEESGLYYHGARYYVPWLCRWTQADPIGIKDGLNVYAYCSNNPVMLHDPSGMSGSGGTEEERPKAAKDTTLAPAPAVVDNCVAPNATNFSLNFVQSSSATGEIVQGAPTLDEMFSNTVSALLNYQIKTDAGLKELSVSISIKFAANELLQKVLFSKLAYDWVNSLSRGIQGFLNNPLGLEDVFNLDGSIAYQGSYDKVQEEKLMDFVNVASFGMEGMYSTAINGGRAATGSVADKGLREIGSVSNLEFNGALKLDDFNIGQGFSGVYDEAADAFMLYPSGENGEILTYASGELIPSNLQVAQRGGHRAVNIHLTTVIGESNNTRVGFSLIKNENNNLVLRFRSGQINIPRFSQAEAPINQQNMIIESIRKHFKDFNLKF